MKPGWIIPLLVLLPNLVWALRRRTDREPEPEATGVLPILENVGRLGAFVIPVFSAFTVQGWAGLLCLAFCSGCLGLYYWCWGRYFRQGEQRRYFYRPLLGIPQPMALLPVLYLGAAAYLLRSPAQLLAALVLGVAHLTLSVRAARQVADG